MTKENFPLADTTMFTRSSLGEKKSSEGKTRLADETKLDLQRKLIPVNPGPRPSRPVEPYSWWTLPSGQLVEVRKIEGEHQPEVVVRNINENSEMAPGEYKLRLAFLVRFGKQVRVAR